MSYTCQAINTNGTSDQIKFKVHIFGKYTGKIDVLGPVVSKALSLNGG